MFTLVSPPLELPTSVGRSSGHFGAIGAGHLGSKMDIRQRLLQATLDVFAETGYRGATTRRIAQQAGVNEVTLFRQFGSKDQLIQEALQCAGHFGEQARLPAEPKDPRRELTQFCLIHAQQFSAGRALVRKVLSEIEEHPEITPFVTRSPSACRLQLLEYLDQLRATGVARAEFEPATAAALLMGAIFADAMVHEVMPPANGASREELVHGFVEMFLRAIGVTSDVAVGAT